MIIKSPSPMWSNLHLISGIKNAFKDRNVKLQNEYTDIWIIDYSYWQVSKLQYKPIKASYHLANTNTLLYQFTHIQTSHNPQLQQQQQ